MSPRRPAWADLHGLWQESLGLSPEEQFPRGRGTRAPARPQGLQEAASKAGDPREPWSVPALRFGGERTGRPLPELFTLLFYNFCRLSGGARKSSGSAKKSENYFWHAEESL